VEEEASVVTVVALTVVVAPTEVVLELMEVQVVEAVGLHVAQPLERIALLAALDAEVVDLVPCRT
jgi:hypothetical protein